MAFTHESTTAENLRVAIATYNAHVAPPTPGAGGITEVADIDPKKIRDPRVAATLSRLLQAPVRFEQHNPIAAAIARRSKNFG